MRLAFDTFVVDFDQRRLFNRDVEVRLPPKAFDLLRLLIDARPKVVTKDDILSAIWPDVFISENNLATVVRDLRSALGDDAHEPRFIRTAYGVGYAFAAPAGEAGDATMAGTAPSGWRLLHEHREIRLREGANVLGRIGHDVVVFDAPTVSRHHAVVRVAGVHASVEDLGSKNGTWVGITPATSPVVLAHGDELRLGSIVATVSYAASVPTTKTSAPGR